MNRILIDSSVHHMRIAVVENGKLVELHWESKAHQSIVGNIYSGRVENVVKGMQAAFVDIGQEKNAYLYYGQERATTDSNPKEGRKLKVGDTVLVQVTKDAVGEKGAVVTEELSFPGRFLVLLPEDTREIGISKKITDTEERNRIKEVLKGSLPEGYSAIVRTNGEKKSKEEYQKELDILLKNCQAIQQFGQYAKPPALLLQEKSPALRIARELYANEVDEIVVNDRSIYEELLQAGDFSQEDGVKLLHYQDNIPIFEAYFVESQAEKALEQRVWLKSGGFLMIQQTEACVVIDVNTGKFTGKKSVEKTILKTNLEAATEIAAQLRLRNLSGIIIVDFIDMVSKEHRRLVQEALEQAVRKDRNKTVVVGMTELGLMQITRKKTRPSLEQQMSVSCRCCNGTGRYPSIDWTVSKLRREIESIFSNTIYQKVIVTANPKVLDAFCGNGEVFLKELQHKFGKTIACVPMQAMAFDKYYIEKQKDS